MKFHLAECKFIICKKMDLGHTSAPKRREFLASEMSPVMAEQDLARSLSEAISRAIKSLMSALNFPSAAHVGLLGNSENSERTA